MIKNFNEYIEGYKQSKVLIVQPHFPVPKKSRNHKNNVPIGLLKIASLLRTKNIDFQLIFFDRNKDCTSQQFPKESVDLILISSIFTYWSKYVKEAVEYYRQNYPTSKIIVGGIYSTLLPTHCLQYTGCDDVFVGQIPEAEELIPAYDLLDIDFQILHTSRGCIRKCGFCGTYKIEPKFLYLKSIKDKIVKKDIVFYDNNLLANPYIEDILNELIDLKKQRKIRHCESQSGFDGRILEQKPHLAKMLKDAGFRNPKIAWDWGYDQKDKIKKEVDLLIGAGYRPVYIGIFVLYNWEIPYEEMEQKRMAIFEWGCTTMDCRFRPLNQTFDEFKMRKQQTNEDYYIHPQWTDKQVKEYRRNIRRTNICTLFKRKYYVKETERGISKEEKEHISDLSYDELINEGYTVYDPLKITPI